LTYNFNKILILDIEIDESKENNFFTSLFGALEVWLDLSFSKIFFFFFVFRSQLYGVGRTCSTPFLKSLQIFSCHYLLGSKIIIYFYISICYKFLENILYMIHYMIHQTSSTPFFFNNMIFGICKYAYIKTIF